LKFFTILVLAATFVASSFAQAWFTNPANGHRYTLVSTQYWHEAEAQAVTLGGHLASINSQQENDWVYNVVIYPITGLSVWIGLYQEPGQGEPNGGWGWTSGEPLVFTNWLEGEPNNGGGVENFGEYFYQTGKWNDTSNQVIPSQYGVVEVVPEPATIAVLGLGLLAVVKCRRH